MLGLLAEGATHIGVATDHVVESFRNDLWEGYKTGEGIEEELHSQFPLLEDALEAAGFAVWRMVETEADDGMATGAALAAADPRVKQVLICTPDKDLAQCVSGTSIVQLDRRKEVTYDEKGVIAKFGVMPGSIPDYLALVGDAADGFPGLPGWGAKSAATLLAHYGHIEEIPDDPRRWQVKVRGAAKLAGTLAQQRELAMLFRKIATVVTDAPEVGPVDSWQWTGPRKDFEEICDYLDAPQLPTRAARLANQRS
jgi:5'-3' exonuclease